MLTHHPDPDVVVSTELPCHRLPVGWKRSSSLANAVCLAAPCRACVPLAVPSWLLPVAEPFQKQPESLAGTQCTTPILFHSSEARSVKEALLSLEARKKTHHCLLSCSNSLPLFYPNCVKVNYLQTEYVGQSWEKSAIFH